MAHLPAVAAELADDDVEAHAARARALHALVAVVLQQLAEPQRQVRGVVLSSDAERATREMSLCNDNNVARIMTGRRKVEALPYGA